MPGQEATTPSASGVRMLVRRRDHKLLGGVCTGLGDYTGLDPIIFRIAFVALAIMGGSGLLLYGLAWLFIPEEGSNRVHAHQLFDRFETTPWLGIALLIGGGALLLSQAGLWRPPIVWGSALLILGIILFREHGTGADHRSAPSMPTSSHASSTRASVASGDAGATAVLPPAVAATPRPPREGSALGWYTIAACLLALGFAALLDAADAIHLTLAQYLALPLAILGGGLLVGAWRGRSRLLIVLGLLLIPFVLVASLIHVPLTGGTGRFVYRPQSTAQLKPAYHLAAGQLTIDLTRLALPTGTTDVTATVGAGEVRVVVPSRVALEIDGRTGLGAVNVFGRAHAGTEVHFRQLANASTSRPQLALHLQAALGSVRIER